jgi:enamine deaminase RidA (YjgF/YER057c/UK114 family)
MGASEGQRVSAPAERPWSKVVGYSRAVRVGHQVEVAGTGPALADGTVVATGDAYAQTVFCLRVIGEALEEVGATFADVIRTRVYLRHIADWEAVGRAHGEIFATIQPASTFVGAGDFLLPEFLVEIEASAVISDQAGSSTA